MVGGWPSLKRRDVIKALRLEGGWCDYDDITLAGFILAVFGTGVAVGKLVEKIERLDRRKEDEEHRNTSKNDRH